MFFLFRLDRFLLLFIVEGMLRYHGFIINCCLLVKLISLAFFNHLLISILLILCST